jgi:ethanolamine ammonia-lyase small subunit
MARDDNHSLIDGPASPSGPTAALTAALEALRLRTPARLIVGRAGASYRTQTQLQLREDHAAAVDAVHAELNLTRDLGTEFVDRFGLFEVATAAADKAQFLQRPELGRMLSERARTIIAQKCASGVDLQVAIGDGLSAAAVTSQVPALLPLLEAGANQRGWTFGQPFVIRHCRVGVLNDLGAALDPAVVVLLIGERPGLASAESLSAYMAFRPRPGHTDAQRNLISNIHARGIDPRAAAERILALAEQMMCAQASGVAIKEQLATCPTGLPDAQGHTRLPSGQSPNVPAAELRNHPGVESPNDPAAERRHAISLGRESQDP